MRRRAAPIVGAAASLVGLTGLVLVLADRLLSPPAQDFFLLGCFLFASGAVTLLVGWSAPQLGQLGILRSLRGKILLLIALISALGIANIAFTSYLMFISPHDLALLTVLLVFSFGVSVSLAFFMTAPFKATIRSLLEAVNRMRAGQLDTRLALQTNDEFEEVASAFNGMASELEIAFERQRALEQARQELIAAVSHDLRSPLASIRAMVESINDGVVTDRDTVQRYLFGMQKEVEYLGRLMDDLFELSQINAGLIALHRERGSLPDLISDTLVSVGAQAEQQQLTVVGRMDEHLAPIFMDTRQVQRVLFNLVQNAFRHTPCGGTIRIEAEELDGEVRVSVTDTGEGISAADLPRVFEAFYRGDQARSRDSSGGGMGLSIADGIVRAHGGRIWVESTPGEGSSFYFTLPRDHQSPERPAMIKRGSETIR
jgi:signal transduction histidine kinase